MVYKINEGDHYPVNTLVPRVFFCKSKFQWKIKFDKDCWYPIPEGGSQDFYDLNKLTGIFIGLKKVGGSYRFAWVPNFQNPGYISIYAYSYQEFHKERFPEYHYMMDVCVETEFDYSMEVTKGGMVIMKIEPTILPTVKVIYEDASSCRSGIIHRPYHGGNLKAPNSYSISVDLVKIQ